jgi:hypothetical protein
MGEDVADDWRAAVAASGWSHHELWLACFALGADAGPAELDAYLEGRARPSVADHNAIAQALNERLHELGHDWPLSYRTPCDQTPPA